MQIYTLPTKTRQLALHEYEQKKRSKTNAYICRWFGFFRLYTGQPLLFILFLFSWILLLPGIIRWIVDGINAGSFVDNKNRELDTFIYLQYK